MKKLSCLAAILTICFCTGVEAAAEMSQSETGKEIAGAISKTHSIWGWFIDYAVLAALVISFLSVLYIWYVAHVTNQRFKMLAKRDEQKDFNETNQASIIVSTHSTDSNNINSDIQKKIKMLESRISALEENTELRTKPNRYTDTEKTNINENLDIHANCFSESLHSDISYDVAKADKFITDYNALYDMSESMAKKNKKIALESNSSLIFFSCSNKGARRQNPNIKPIYARKEEKGDYIAYSIGGVHYAVIPAYTSYETTRHNEWAFGEVFDSNYTSGTYTKIRVEKPAIFTISDDRCTLEGKGNLVLSK